MLTHYNLPVKPSCRKPMKIDSLHVRKVLENLPDIEDVWDAAVNNNDPCTLLADHLYNACAQATNESTNTIPTQVQCAEDHWKWILERGSLKDIWHAIGWSGNIVCLNTDAEQPRIQAAF